MDFTLRAVDIDKDAEKLAAMWNASDDQWPGTWSGGVPITPGMVRERLEREARIEASVWDAGDSIAGYCSVWKDIDEQDVAYIPLLNVSPEFQGKSLGRKFLTHWVERTRDLGFTRLDLHTWGGNLKAVPLYKKTGFFWMPDAESSGVHMLNFIPGILSTPLLKPFFDKHDWYSSFRRDLVQAEDDERWEGMKVFTYRFEGDGEALTVWADRLSRKITAIETADIFASALAEELEPARGLSTPIRWRLTNKSELPLQVSVVAMGSEYLKVDHQKTVDLAPAESVTLEGKVEVDAQIPDSKVEKGKPAPAIKSIVVVNGRVVELGTGLRPRSAIEIDTHPARLSLPAGKPTRVQIQLRNRMKREVEAKVSAAPQPGLESDWTEKVVRLAADSFAGVPLELTSANPGAHGLAISASFDAESQQVEVPSKLRYAFSGTPTGLLAEKEDRLIRIENERLRVILHEGGSLSIGDLTGDRLFGSEVGYPAPPSAPSEYWTATYDLALEREPGAAIAVASYKSKREPGFVFEKRVRVSASSVVEVSYEFQNVGPHRRHLQLVQSVMREGASWITLPLREGLARGPSGDFPGPSDDDAKKPDAYAERWIAFETEHGTFGVVWPAEISEISWDYGFELRGEMVECSPQSRVPLPPLLIHVAEEGWRGTRRLWQRLQGIDASKEVAVDPAVPISVRTEPPVLVAADGEADGKVVIEHFRSRAVAGSARLRLPAGWTASPTEIDLKDLNIHEPSEIDLHLSTTSPPGGSAGAVEVVTPDYDIAAEIPLIRLGDGGDVKVREATSDGQSLLTVDNGRVEFDAAPDFSGTISSWREGGVEHLASSFPTPSTLGFLGPWYGGITPIVMVTANFPGRTYKERFVAEPMSSVDSLGTEWTGVRQSADLTDEEDARGLRLEFEALTTGGSPILKLITRLINRTSAFRRPTAGWMSFLQPDGSRGETVLHAPDYRLKHTKRFVQLRGGHWIAVQNPDSGRSIIAISPRPQLFGLDWAGEGAHLGFLEQVTVPPEGPIERVAYLALAPDMDAAKALVPLKHLA